MTELKDLGLTDEQFIDQYVEKAKESIDSADAWVNDLFGGKPSAEFIARLAPVVLSKLNAEGLLGAPVAIAEETPTEGTTDVENASPEAVQELSEASEEG